jgi:transposase InsO family protein
LEDVQHDQPNDVFLFPSQLLLIEVLRRPVESTQYLSIRYSERLAEAGAVASVGSRGDSYDNSLAETIIGLYKTEVIRRRGPWKSIDDVEFATLEWIDGFNNRRLLEPIGDIPPAEYEMLYWTESGRSDTVGLTELSLH